MSQITVTRGADGQLQAREIAPGEAVPAATQQEVSQ